MDIDSDFCIEKGPLVFKYLNDKYGKENCCNIITFSRLTTKMVIKDVSKALDIPFKEVNAFTAMLPSGPNDDITIDEILNDPKIKSTIEALEQEYNISDVIYGEGDFEEMSDEEFIATLKW